MTDYIEPPEYTDEIQVMVRKGFTPYFPNKTPAYKHIHSLYQSIEGHTVCLGLTINTTTYRPRLQASFEVPCNSRKRISVSRAENGYITEGPEQNQQHIWSNIYDLQKFLEKTFIRNVYLHQEYENYQAMCNHAHLVGYEVPGEESDWDEAVAKWAAENNKTSEAA